MLEHRLTIRGFIDPRWLRQVEHGQHIASVAKSGTVTLQGVSLYFDNNTTPYPPGTSVIVWLGRCFYCRSVIENEAVKKEAASQKAAYEEAYRESLNINRKEAEAFNARILLPVQWTTGIKDVLSGLSETSWGDGTYARTVTHILLKEPFNSGRLARSAGDFLCSSNQDMNGKGWSGNPEEIWYDSDNNSYRPKVTCKKCLQLAERWIKTNQGVQQEQPGLNQGMDSAAARYFERDQISEMGYDR